MSSSSSSSKKKMITLKSSDDEIFEVEEAVAVQSETLKNLIEDGCADSAIPLQNVTGQVLFKVIRYCKKHAEAAGKEASKFSDEENNELKNYDKDFVKVDQAVLFDLTLAANYLNIKSLLDLTCHTVADMMRGRSPEEIRKIFHIKNDLSPAEEEKIRKENQWAFE